jgi:hypothetical protein
MKISATNELVIGILAVVSILLLFVESVVALSQGMHVFIYVVDFLIDVFLSVDFFRCYKDSDNKSKFRTMGVRFWLSFHCSHYSHFSRKRFNQKKGALTMRALFF